MLEPAIDPELTKRLGQIVIRWALLESLISALLATVAKSDPGAMLLITNKISTAILTRWIRGLMARHCHAAADNKRIAKLLERSDKLRGERNELVHGLWDATDCEPKTAKVQTINLERSQPARTRLVTFKELDEFVGQIDKWIADYTKLGRELGFPRKFGETKSIFTD